MREFHYSVIAFLPAHHLSEAKLSDTQQDPDLLTIMETADPDQRLALAKGGITLAILQEQMRMGFSDDEVATVLAMREDNSVNEEMKFLWLKRLAQFREALEGA